MGRRRLFGKPGPEYRFEPYPPGTCFLMDGLIHRIESVDWGSAPSSTFLRVTRKHLTHEEPLIMRLSEVMRIIEDNQREIRARTQAAFGVAGVPQVVLCLHTAQQEAVNRLSPATATVIVKIIDEAIQCVALGRRREGGEDNMPCKPSGDGKKKGGGGKKK